MKVTASEREDPQMKRIESFVRWLFVVTLAVAGIARAQSGDQAKASGNSTMAAVALNAPTKDAEPSEPNTYVIGAGDVLNVNIWRESEVSQKLAVRPDGIISLPLIGDVRAGGETPENLAGIISNKLKAYLKSPLVTVTVVEVNSKWFTVVGQVNKPGRYPLARPLTALEALSQAGGFQEFAKPNKTYILHVVNGKMVRLPFHYSRVLKGNDLHENVEVNNGDTIVVP